MDLVAALSSYECEMRNNPEQPSPVKHLDQKKNIKLTKLAPEGGDPNA